MNALALWTALVPLSPVDSGLENDFDVALGMAGLSTETARFDKGILPFYRQSDRPSALYDPCIDDPWRIPFYVDMARRQIALTPAQPVGLIENASRLLGQGSRRSLLGDAAQSPVAASQEPNALGKALARMKAEGLIKTTIPPLTDVPPAVQRAAAVVIYAALDAVEYRRAAVAGVSDLPGAFAAFANGTDEPESVTAERRQLEIGRQCDMAYLYAAAQEVAAAATYARSLTKPIPPNAVFDFKLDTDWGKIDLSGGKDSTHDGVATFILIDTGGNDTYVNTPCNTSVTNWLSVAIDVSGNDKYLSDPALAKTPVAEWTLRSKQKGRLGPGSALFGMSFLLDLAGDDLYRSTRSSFGSATFGVAYLGDYGGKDAYDAYADSEGFGHHGVGILDDTEGNDTYEGFTQVQGVGLPLGMGILIDQSGDDTYNANDKVLDFPSAQTADHNNSMSQGAGYGFRADYLTGHSQSGGIGLLYDLAGKDHYTCGVFGQGVGYWEGVGMLWDAGGDDTYTGQWYVQGASAHFGIGYLEDGGGADVYDAAMNMAQGAGHDFGVGMLIDRAGNDRHQAPNLSLGAGNANGIGVFVDTEGDDTYSSSGLTLGSSAEAQKGSLRERAISLGLFMDLGGTDSYPEAATWARNGSRTTNWKDKGAKPGESQLGLFLDR